MFENFPTSYQAVQDWSWADFEPFYKDLLDRPLSQANLDAWLKDVSHFYDIAYEAYVRLEVAHTCDTTDEAVEKKYMNFLENLIPPLSQAGNELNKKLVASGLTPDNFEVPMKHTRNQIELFREENLPLFVEDQKLASELEKTIGAQTVQWEGEEVTLPRLKKVLMDSDREVREDAWRLMMDRALKDRATINGIYGKMLELRTQIAKNAGFEDYRAFRFRQLGRFDYTPADTKTFRDAIEKVVVPAAKRLYERRQQQLKVESLRPWDLDVDALGEAPLHPFDEVDDLISKVANMFQKVDPKLGGYFNDMHERGLLDLDNRKGKAPGGYCTNFAYERVPFIFMNAVGIHDDVQTMLHEGGHAFHVYETRDLPYSQQKEYPIEFAEVASMSMELIAGPYLTADQGGYYTPAEAARARIEHLESLIQFWPYMAVVDGFQDWAYTHIEDAKDPAKCDATWNDLWDRFMQGVDWRGLEDAKVTGWQRKHHIYTHPFYYVEYGLAQFGAVQVWANSLEDQAKAVADYRKALSLGGTASLPDLFKTAGAKFSFDAATLQKAVDLIEKTLAELEAV